MKISKYVIMAEVKNRKQNLNYRHTMYIILIVKCTLYSIHYIITVHIPWWVFMCALRWMRSRH